MEWGGNVSVSMNSDEGKERVRKENKVKKKTRGVNVRRGRVERGMEDQRKKRTAESLLFLHLGVGQYNKHTQS
jgi:hypothetical protein